MHTLSNSILTINIISSLAWGELIANSLLLIDFRELVARGEAAKVRLNVIFCITCLCPNNLRKY